METVAARLKEALKNRNMKQADLSRLTGIGKSSISTYLTGAYIPKQKNIYKMAKALNVSEAWLMGHDVSMKRLPLNEGNSECAAAAENDLFPHDLPHLQRIPILGQIRAGLPLYADEHIEGYTYTELNGGAEYFGLRVTGDSMNAAHINLGDILIVRRQNTVENGEIAVVLVDNEAATVKRFYQDGNSVTLVPQSNNPEHVPLMIDLRKTPISILGKVVRNQIDF